MADESQANGDWKAAVAYILTWITGLIIFLIADKNDRFVRFHAMQAIILGIALFVLWAVLQLFAILPDPIGAIFGIAQSLLALVALILIVIGIVTGATGRRWKMPLLGNYAEKYA